MFPCHVFRRAVRVTLTCISLSRYGRVQAGTLAVPIMMSSIVIGPLSRRVGTRILGRAYSDLRAPLRSYTIGLAWPLRMRGRTTIWSGRNEMNLCCKDDVGWVSL